MDRVINYPGQIPLETDVLKTNRFAMVALAKLAAAVLGTSTQVNGLACTPTSPASMQVQIAPGEIYALANLDGSAYSTLAADTTHQVLKQGVNLDNTTLTLTAPGGAGNSINYLIQAAFQEVDTGTVVLPYYNSANPSLAYSGPGNSGTSQATVRSGIVVLSVKAGAAAPTGTQTTPAPDAGYVGLWVVTVANGQTTITSGNITKVVNAPFMTSSGVSGWINYVISEAGLSPDITASNQLKAALDILYNVVGIKAVRRQVISASGVYTPDAHLLFADVELSAGGGGGGGSSTGGGQGGAGGGGGAGGHARGIFTAATIGSSQSVTIGPAGAAGASSGASGGNGGTTSFGSLMSATGGVGGAFNYTGSAIAVANGGPGGTASGGLVNRTGGAGADGWSGQYSGLMLGGQGGQGGSSGFGPGGASVFAQSATKAGVTPPAPGAGGSGAATGGAGSAAGGAGAPGIVVITEYCYA